MSRHTAIAVLAIPARVPDDGCMQRRLDDAADRVELFFGVNAAVAIGFRSVRLRSQTRLSIKIHTNSEPVNGGVKIRHIVECTPAGVQVDGLRLDYAVRAFRGEGHGPSPHP